MNNKNRGQDKPGAVSEAKALPSLAELQAAQKEAKENVASLKKAIKEASSNSTFLYRYDQLVTSPKTGVSKTVSKLALGKPSDKRRVTAVWEVTLGENPTIALVPSTP